MAVERQTSALPPAQPSYILRGHRSQIHSVQFVRQNSRLLTGDADGWVVYWKLETKRALAAWKAHDGAILGTGEWGQDKFTTHGRDNNLRIWQLRSSDEATLSTTLPAEDSKVEQPKPWLLHTLPVNTLNFCAFSMCYEHEPQGQHSSTRPSNGSILIATPSTDDKKINIYQFPEEKLKYVVPKASTADTGMVMAVKLVRHAQSSTVLVLAGYEGGVTSVHQLPSGISSTVRTAQLVYLSQPHTQPILSLDATPDARTYFTSSADAIIASHRISDLAPAEAVAGAHVTGQKSIFHAKSEATSEASTIASNGSITTSPPTGGPEKLTKKTPDLSKSTADPESPSLSFTKCPVANPQPTLAAGLSSLLSSANPIQRSAPLPPRPTPTSFQPPHKITNTKHSGQQSLRVRSDGRIFVTAGWDSRIRIYSTKTLKEVAVLKWHKEGVYAVDFAVLLEAGDLQGNEGGEGGEVVKKETGLGKVQRQREEAMQLKHWVVAGAKDGKVSLWEVF